MQNINCSICSEFFAGEVDKMYSKELQQVHDSCGRTSRILYENDNYMVIPTLGPVAECHLLLLPKQHVSSFALLSKEQLKEAECLIQKICNIVNKKYGNSIVFEHGTLDRSIQASASCNHAHMHIVSCNRSLIPFLINDGLQLRKLEGLDELCEQQNRRLPYFYYCENNLEAYIMDDIIRMSQYMRILVARVLNSPQKGNWKENLGLSEVITMIIQIEDELRKL